MGEIMILQPSDGDWHLEVPAFANLLRQRWADLIIHEEVCQFDGSKQLLSWWGSEDDMAWGEGGSLWEHDGTHDVSLSKATWECVAEFSVWLRDQYPRVAFALSSDSRGDICQVTNEVTPAHILDVVGEGAIARFSLESLQSALDVAVGPQLAEAGYMLSSSDLSTDRRLGLKVEFVRVSGSHKATIQFMGSCDGPDVGLMIFAAVDEVGGETTQRTWGTWVKAAPSWGDVAWKFNSGEPAEKSMRPVSSVLAERIVPEVERHLSDPLPPIEFDPSSPESMMEMLRRYGVTPIDPPPDITTD